MNVNFKKNPLIPVIIQHFKSKQVLMLGFMNEEAYKKTRAEKQVTFYSRSKKRLWTKGETSGNYLKVIDILSDCDEDTLLIKTKPMGHTCHTGSFSCFGAEEKSLFLFELEEIINERKNNPSKTSYISSLFKKGINKISQKFGEEAVELVIEAKDENEELFKNEAADLLFHYLILLNKKGLSLEKIIEILEARHQHHDSK